MLRNRNVKRSWTVTVRVSIALGRQRPAQSKYPRNNREMSIRLLSSRFGHGDRRRVDTVLRVGDQVLLWAKELLDAVEIGKL
jgi:hypothetical protein